MPAIMNTKLIRCQWQIHCLTKRSNHEDGQLHLVSCYEMSGFSFKRDGQCEKMISVRRFSSFEVHCQFPVFPLGGRAGRVRIGVLPGRLGCGGFICWLMGADGRRGFGGRSSQSTAWGLTSIGRASWHLLCLLVFISAWNSLLGHLKTQRNVIIATVIFQDKGVNDK